jgi:glycosyltransferase involved in cell wall biosynthesis
MLSIIVPVLNESDSLAQLHREICQSCAAHEIDFEVVFIDDGSTDGSWQTIEELSLADERVSGIRFRRNFG